MLRGLSRGFTERWTGSAGQSFLMASLFVMAHLFTKDAVPEKRHEDRETIRKMHETCPDRQDFQ
jgi:hypothetical protein